MPDTLEYIWYPIYVDTFCFLLSVKQTEPQGSFSKRIFCLISSKSETVKNQTTLNTYSNAGPKALYIQQRSIIQCQTCHEKIKNKSMCTEYWKRQDRHYLYTTAQNFYFQNIRHKVVK